MPHGQHFSVTDPYAFQASLRALDYDVLVKSRGSFEAEVARIDLHRLWMQRSETNLPWIMRFGISGRAPVSFLAREDSPPIKQNGVELTAADIFLHGQGTNRTWTTGPTHVAAMALTLEEMATAAKALTGRPFEFPLHSHVVRPTAASMTRLRTLHTAVCQFARYTPETLANPAMARALEQELVHALVTCLTEQRLADMKCASVNHAKVVNRLEEFFRERDYEPVYLPEICGAIDVSERTLRAICHEYLGVGPARYLWLRRMDLVRRALLVAEFKTTTVTAIATEHGFWELGRFSVEYNALFGESPSASLRRPSQVLPLGTDRRFKLTTSR